MCSSPGPNTHCFLLQVTHVSALQWSRPLIAANAGDLEPKAQATGQQSVGSKAWAQSLMQVALVQNAAQDVPCVDSADSHMSCANTFTPCRLLR